jgi:hypothetical protein
LFTAQPTSAITWDEEKRALQTVIAAHECKEVSVSSQLATPINASTIKTSTISADLTSQEREELYASLRSKLGINDRLNIYVLEF